MTELMESSVDWRVVDSWVVATAVGDGQITHVEQIGGGSQNLMCKFQCGHARLVSRRGPRHLRPHSDDALRREARALVALYRTGVPITRLVAADHDESVLRSVFYLMEPVDGFDATLGLPPHSNSRFRRAMEFSAVDALIALGEVVPEEVGLGDLEGFLERQVPQWLSTLDQSSALDGYPGHQLPHVSDIASWLAGWLEDIARRRSILASCTATSLGKPVLRMVPGAR